MSKQYRYYEINKKLKLYYNAPCGYTFYIHHCVHKATLNANAETNFFHASIYGCITVILLFNLQSEQKIVRDSLLPTPPTIPTIHRHDHHETRTISPTRPVFAFRLHNTKALMKSGEASHFAEHVKSSWLAVLQECSPLWHAGAPGVALCSQTRQCSSPSRRYSRLL